MVVLTLASIAMAKDIELSWDIEMVGYNMADLSTRKAIGVNGQWRQFLASKQH
ncbi:hypothetical protein GGF46_004171 [Coemansia sp. RSA 552]|nr:hypothetical protein GGF46_004171 [Coemansia sp. RSA 552]